MNEQAIEEYKYGARVFKINMMAFREFENGVEWIHKNKKEEFTDRMENGFIF